MNNDQIKSILRKSKVIAMIGVSSEKKGEDRKNLKRKPANVQGIVWRVHILM